MSLSPLKWNPAYALALDNNSNRFTALCPGYPGDPVSEETFTHPPSWSSSSIYQLLPSRLTTISSLALDGDCYFVQFHSVTASTYKQPVLHSECYYCYSTNKLCRPLPIWMCHLNQSQITIIADLNL